MSSYEQSQQTEQLNWITIIIIESNKASMSNMMFLSWST